MSGSFDHEVLQSIVEREFDIRDHRSCMPASAPAEGRKVERMGAFAS